MLSDEENRVTKLASHYTNRVLGSCFVFRRQELLDFTRGVAEAAVNDKVVGKEPVAVVGDAFQLLWCGSYSFAEHAKKHGLKVGSLLYTLPPSRVEASNELVELVSHFKFISQAYDTMKRSTSERFLECLGYTELPEGWESMNLSSLLAVRGLTNEHSNQKM